MPEFPTVGSYVWAKMTGFPYWPGIVSDPPDDLDEEVPPIKFGQSCIYFYGTCNYGVVDDDKLKDYFEHKEVLSKANKTASFRKAVRDIDKCIEKNTRCKVKAATYDLLPALDAAGITKNAKRTPFKELFKKIREFTFKKYGKDQMTAILAESIADRLLSGEKLDESMKTRPSGTPKRLSTSLSPLGERVSSDLKNGENKASGPGSSLVTPRKRGRPRKYPLPPDPSSSVSEESVPKEKELGAEVTRGSEVESSEDEAKVSLVGSTRSSSTSSSSSSSSSSSDDDEDDEESEPEIQWEQIQPDEILSGPNEEFLRSLLYDVLKECTESEGEASSSEESEEEPARKKVAVMSDSSSPASPESSETSSSSSSSSDEEEPEEQQGDAEEVDERWTTNYSFRMSSMSVTTRPESPVVDVNEHSRILLEKEIDASAFHIGFIGAGRIGSGLLKNLIHSKHKVTIWNRSPEKCEKFEKLGAEIALTPSDVVSVADITFCCVSNQNAALELFFGNCGVLGELENDKGYVGLTSVDPESSEKIQDAVENKDGRYLEVRFLGGRQDAEDGSLHLLCSGDRSLFEDCESCFAAWSLTADFLGPDVGDATKSFLTFHAVEAVVLSSVCEVFYVGETKGITQEELAAYLDEHQLFSDHIAEKVHAILEYEFVPDHPLANLQTDVKLWCYLARKWDLPCLLPASALEYIAKAKQLGLGEHDSASIIFGVRNY